jgi:hypothetical protein
MNPSKLINDPLITDPVSRRQFLKTASIGALGALILQQKAYAYSLGESQRILTVLGIVDITQCLANMSILNNVYWIDNNRLLGSRNEGTNTLITSVKNGDIINWVVIGLEVETMGYIHGIEGSVVPIAAPAFDPSSPFGSWKGTVNTSQRGFFPYTITLLVEDIVMPMTTTLALEIA